MFTGRHGQERGECPQALRGGSDQLLFQRFSRGPQELGFLAAKGIKSSESCRAFAEQPAADSLRARCTRLGLPAEGGQCFLTESHPAWAVHLCCSEQVESKLRSRFQV